LAGREQAVADLLQHPALPFHRPVEVGELALPPRECTFDECSLRSAKGGEPVCGPLIPGPSREVISTVPFGNRVPRLPLRGRFGAKMNAIVLFADRGRLRAECGARSPAGAGLWAHFISQVQPL